MISFHVLNLYGGHSKLSESQCAAWGIWLSFIKQLGLVEWDSRTTVFKVKCSEIVRNRCYIDIELMVAREAGKILIQKGLGQAWRWQTVCIFYYQQCFNIFLTVLTLNRPWPDERSLHNFFSVFHKYGASIEMTAELSSDTRTGFWILSRGCTLLCISEIDCLSVLVWSRTKRIKYMKCILRERL